MPDIWAYCNSCQRWFYAGSDAAMGRDDTSCPVCAHPPVCLSDHSDVEALS